MSTRVIQVEAHPGASAAAASADLEMQPLAATPSSLARRSTTGKRSASRRDLAAAETLAATPHAPPQLRVSPLVFFLFPAIAFYCSALLASFTLHFSSDGGLGYASSDPDDDLPCQEALRTFLWGAVLAGYGFLLAWAWMVVGPRWESAARWKWLLVLGYLLALGVLTGLGARQIVGDRAASKRCQSSVRFYVCAYITLFYSICWLGLAILIALEVSLATCRKPKGRIVILGIGAGLGKLHLRDLPASSVLFSIMGKFPVGAGLSRRKTRGMTQRELITAALQGEETTLLGKRGGDSTDRDGEGSGVGGEGRGPIRRDNFFDGEKKYPDGEEKSESKKPVAGAQRSLSDRFTFNNRVAPEPEPATAADGGEDTPTARRRKMAERQQADATAAAAALLGTGGGAMSSPLLDQFNSSSSGPNDERKEDPLLGPTPAQRKATLPPLPAAPSQPAQFFIGSESDDEDDVEMIFHNKIAANKAAQERRKQELAQVAAQQQQQPMQPLPQQAPQAFAPASASVTASAPAVAPSAPVSILRTPTVAPAGSGTAATAVAPSSSKFKMVDFESASRLEAVRTLEHETPMEQSWDSSAGMGMDSQRSDAGGPLQQQAQQQQDVFAARTPSRLPPLQPPNPFAPVNPAFGYAQGAAPLPPAFAYPSSSPQSQSQHPRGPWPPPPPPVGGPAGSPMGGGIALGSPAQYPGGWMAPPTPGTPYGGGAAGAPMPPRLPPPLQQFPPQLSPYSGGTMDAALSSPSASPANPAYYSIPDDRRF